MNNLTQMNYASALKSFELNQTNYISYFDSLKIASQKMLIAALSNKSKSDKSYLQFLDQLKPRLKKEVYDKTKSVLTFDDLSKIKDYAETLDIAKKAIILTLTETGCRKFEVIQIWQAFDNKPTLFIKSKANKEAKIYINDKLMNCLNKWTNSTNFRLYSPKHIENVVKSTLNALNLKGTPHDLRRAFATNLRKNCVNLEQIQIFLRHNDINTTLKYIKHSDEEMIDILNKMNENKANEWINENNYKQKMLELIDMNNKQAEEIKKLKQRIHELENGK